MSHGWEANIVSLSRLARKQGRFWRSVSGGSYCTYCTILWIKQVLHVIRSPRTLDNVTLRYTMRRKKVHIYSYYPVHQPPAFLWNTLQSRAFVYFDTCTPLWITCHKMTSAGSRYLFASVSLSYPWRDPVFYIDDSRQEIVDPAFPLR